MTPKIIEVAGKKYTLTANRNVIRTISNIVPEVLKMKIDPKKDGDAFNDVLAVLSGLQLMSELDVLFYDMIKVAHPEITKDKSDEILDNFEKEYNNVQENLLKFAFSVFNEGNPSKNKKNLNW